MIFPVSDDSRDSAGGISGARGKARLGPDRLRYALSISAALVAAVVSLPMLFAGVVAQGAETVRPVGSGHVSAPASDSGGGSGSARIKPLSVIPLDPQCNPAQLKSTEQVAEHLKTEYGALIPAASKCNLSVRAVGEKNAKAHKQLVSVQCFSDPLLDFRDERRFGTKTCQIEIPHDQFVDRKVLESTMQLLATSFTDLDSSVQASDLMECRWGMGFPDSRQCSVKFSSRPK